MVTVRPMTEYKDKKDVYADFEIFIYSAKHCVRINEDDQYIEIDDANKLEALISYVENFIFSIKDLFISGIEHFSMSLGSMREEMEREFCVPTKRQFDAVIATIKAELREYFTLVESPNHLTFSRIA